MAITRKSKRQNDKKADLLGKKPSLIAKQTKKANRKEAWKHKVATSAALRLNNQPVFSLDLSTLQKSLPIDATLSNDGKQNSRPEGKTPFVSITPIKSSKSRSKLAKNEIEQFQKVVNHSVFASNPIATLQTHLTHALHSTENKTKK